MFIEPVMGLRPFLVPFRLLQAIGILTFSACAVSKDRRLHTAALVLVVVLIVTAVTLTRYTLGQPLTQ